MTLPEILLWQQLRRKGTGHHWRHEHPAGRYSLDFYCDAAKLCVEADGEAHARRRAPLHRPSDGPPPPAELGEE